MTDVDVAFDTSGLNEPRCPLIRRRFTLNIDLQAAVGGYQGDTLLHFTVVLRVTSQLGNFLRQCMGRSIRRLSYLSCHADLPPRQSHE